MTSNLGADLIRKSTEVGFGAKEGALDYKSMQEKIESSAKKFFKPEFLNRLDGLVIFKTLDKVALRQVVDLEVSNSKTRLAHKNIEITLDDAARDFIVDKGYLPEMGVRPLRRVIEQYFEDPLAEKVLQQPDTEQHYLITVKDGAISFVNTVKAAVSEVAKEPATAK